MLYSDGEETLCYTVTEEEVCYEEQGRGGVLYSDGEETVCYTVTEEEVCYEEQGRGGVL